MKSINEIALEKRGFREKFAMSVGTCIVEYYNGKPYYKWTYDPDIEYQDANGRTFDPEKMEWIG